MIEDLRRNAYIDAIMAAQDQTVVSLFGIIPWEIFYAFDLLPIYAYGIDYFVVENERPICSTLNSTLEYHLHDRCPFMNTSTYYFVDTYCEKRREVVETYFHPVVIYENIPQLISILEEITNTDFDEEKLNEIVEQSKEISREILRLRQSNLPEKEINLYQ